MKKIIYIIGGVIGGIILLVLLWQLTQRVITAVGGSYDSRNFVDETRLANATTTVTYMGPGLATTTLSVEKSRYDELALNIQFTASTSASILNIQFQSSMDNVDWYNEDVSGINAGNTVLSTLYHSSSTITHFIQPGSTTASTTRKQIMVPNMPGNYIRAIATVPVGSASSSIWMSFSEVDK